MPRAALRCLVALPLVACAGAKDAPLDGDDGAAPEAPTALGEARGALAPEALTWTPILTDADALSDPRDLGFDPEGRLWVANREDDRTFIVTAPGTTEQTSERRRDAAAMHFMEEVSSLAFEGPEGASPFGTEFGSCGESENTYNDRHDPNMFMGPVLWATDLEIFAEQDPFGLGSHLDMLHQSPNCVGMAWEFDNVYWVFDGKENTIVRYDFAEDHGIGQDDHSDGVVHRLSEPTVTRVVDAPGHLMIDPSTGLLYVADTGGGRVLVLDPSTGGEGRNLRATNEPLDAYVAWDGVEWWELATGLDHPGGLAVGGGFVYVAEWATGHIKVFEPGGALVQDYDTGRGPGALYGIELGPDGALWVTDNLTPGVYRLDVAR